MGERPRLLTPEQVGIALRLYAVRHPFEDWPSVLLVPAERILRSFRCAEPPAELVDAAEPSW